VLRVDCYVQIYLFFTSIRDSSSETCRIVCADVLLKDTDANCQKMAAQSLSLLQRLVTQVVQIIFIVVCFTRVVYIIIYVHIYLGFYFVCVVGQPDVMGF
jgi:hypothetical protein